MEQTTQKNFFSFLNDKYLMILLVIGKDGAHSNQNLN